MSSSPSDTSALADMLAATINLESFAEENEINEDDNDGEVEDISFHNVDEGYEGEDEKSDKRTVLTQILSRKQKKKGANEAKEQATKPCGCKIIDRSGLKSIKMKHPATSGVQSESESLAALRELMENRIRKSLRSICTTHLDALARSFGLQTEGLTRIHLEKRMLKIWIHRHDLTELKKDQRFNHWF